ncbi:Arm DNA-binding domain-containing protein [Brochothrix campestris]|uniref:Integrase (Phage-like protein) n=1 Tax=Brochothrix campestris FSL F6-1037 TaxID=1265861 RepID=W7CYW7_9LIST|nr:Arm DNA-binding domain-containing protein [Brochothrix campestris]EUJ41945.1 integrase (phage-like protein) [Brochothrix campestris FSL F6-1037]
MASYKKLKSGWQFRISFYIGGVRKTKSVNGFRTKSEAQIAATELEQQLSRGNSLTAGEIPFVQYFTNWYTLFRKGKLSWKNDRDIEISINTAERFFKATKLKDIDRHLYQEFLNDYGATHATATVKKNPHLYTRLFTGCIK